MSESETLSSVFLVLCALFWNSERVIAVLLTYAITLSRISARQKAADSKKQARSRKQNNNFAAFALLQVAGRRKLLLERLTDAEMYCAKAFSLLSAKFDPVVNAQWPYRGLVPKAKTGCEPELCGIYILNFLPHIS